MIFVSRESAHQRLRDLGNVAGRRKMTKDTLKEEKTWFVEWGGTKGCAVFTGMLGCIQFVVAKGSAPARRKIIDVLLLSVAVIMMHLHDQHAWLYALTVLSESFVTSPRKTM